MVNKTVYKKAPACVAGACQGQCMRRKMFRVNSCAHDSKTMTEIAIVAKSHIRKLEHGGALLEDWNQYTTGQNKTQEGF